MNAHVMPMCMSYLLSYGLLDMGHPTRCLVGHCPISDLIVYLEVYLLVVNTRVVLVANIKTQSICEQYVGQ